MGVDLPDVDLDVKNRDKTVSLFEEIVSASQLADDRLVKHNTGVYFQKIPQDPTNGLAVFPFDIAEELGYYKVDMIANHVYDMLSSETELQRLLDAPVDWEWFQDGRFFGRNGLTHLGTYDWLCKKFPPKSVIDIAALLATIRPRMRHLKNECKDLEEIKDRCWNRSEGSENDYFFKKSHSVAFAMLVILHAQIIARKLEPKTYESDGDFFI